ncbi:MAG: NAD-dependent epimerase/dehydratase family protein, partial [Anaerolineales bacterium]|nr:NAD-dependent epimerase/dehydratase family protein [Anaerolineales bacterium]
MKVLITGGAGFIGSHVADAYLEAGAQVLVVDDLSSGSVDNLDRRLRLIEMDIRSPELRDVFTAERPEIVNHHAAQIDVRRSVADPQMDASTNILGALNVLECARQQQVSRFLYASTGGAVYGEPVELPCREDHPIRPICPYGASKHAFEHYLEMYSALYGLPYSILRYANVYGPRQDPLGEAGVVAIFTAKMLAGEAIVVNGDGEQTRDFVFVGDVARANLLATGLGEACGTFNIGTGVGTSINEVFGHLKRATGYRLAPSHGPAKHGETRHIYLDSSHAAEVLGWSAEVALGSGLA